MSHASGRPKHAMLCRRQNVRIFESWRLTEMSTANSGDHPTWCRVTISASSAWHVKDWNTENEAKAAVYIQSLAKPLARCTWERKVTTACKSSLYEATTRETEGTELRSPWEPSHYGVFQMSEMKL